MQGAMMKRDNPAMPPIVDRGVFQAQLDALRDREKAHTREGDAIAAARRRLPMVEVDATPALIGPHGPLTLLEAFEGRRQLIAYYFMWHAGRPAAEQCEGCTWVTTQIAELSYLHSRDITFAVFCQGPYDESIRYRDFMGWNMPWYSAQDSLNQLLVGREIGLFHIVCYLRDGDRVFETYWTKRRGAEAMDYSYALMDLTVYGRQENWEDSPAGWPQHCSYQRTDAGSPDWPPVPVSPGGRPIAQWPRIDAGRSDKLSDPQPPESTEAGGLAARPAQQDPSQREVGRELDRMHGTGMTINHLWWRGDEAAWRSRLDVYWSLLRPELLGLEREMEALDPSAVWRMGPDEWYQFLLDKYFRWKYTAPNRYATTTRQLKKYGETGALDELHRIKADLFTIGNSDIASKLSAATRIRGLGPAGASGLLSLLFPGEFGTVDQFVVKALQQVEGLPQSRQLSRMVPEGLTINDSVLLIGIMRAKAEDLGKKFGADFWTPRRVDMALWTYGR